MTTAIATTEATSISICLRSAHRLKSNSWLLYSQLLLCISTQLPTCWFACQPFVIVIATNILTTLLIPLLRIAALAYAAWATNCCFAKQHTMHAE